MRPFGLGKRVGNHQVQKASDTYATGQLRNIGKFVKSSLLVEHFSTPSLPTATRLAGDRELRTEIDEAAKQT